MDSKSVGGNERETVARLASLPAPWRSGYAAACKAVYTGSIPVGASHEAPANAGVSSFGRLSVDADEMIRILEEIIRDPETEPDCTLHRDPNPAGDRARATGDWCPRCPG